MVLALAVTGPCLAEEEPEPTPTPAPESDHEPTLSEVAKGIHLRVDEDQETDADGSIVITNENISDYASKSLLTERKTPLQDGGTEAGDALSEGDSGEESDQTKKKYWRDKYLKKKTLIESLEQEIEELDSEIPALWSKFYSWDDPAYRDGVIKPNLDSAIGRRDELAKRIEVEKEALPEILEQARKDGAKPGWFRDLT
jgi:hypothetical protein